MTFKMVGEMEKEGGKGERVVLAPRGSTKINIISKYVCSEYSRWSINARGLASA